VASPVSSLLWVQNMVLAKQGGELEVARGVAKRALQRINFRLEAERSNVFLAWLNLENSFGPEEAMGEVMEARWLPSTSSRARWEKQKRSTRSWPGSSIKKRKFGIVLLQEQ
jgi:hypothetical protein